MKWKESGTQFEKAPSGSHVARCYALVDLGTQPQRPFQGEERPPARMVRISFELPTEKMLGTFDEKAKGRPFSVHVTLKQSLHPKANLRRYLEGWRGKKFTPETIATFDPKKLIGLPCRLALVENGDYINVDSISPLGKDDVKKMPKAVNAPVFLSLEPEEFEQEMFNQLSEKTRAKIAASPEYKIFEGGATAGEEPQADADPVEGAEAEPGEVPF